MPHFENEFIFIYNQTQWGFELGIWVFLLHELKISGLLRLL